MANQRVWLDSRDCGLQIIESERHRAAEYERRRKKDEERKRAEEERQRREEMEQKARQEAERQRGEELERQRRANEELQVTQQGEVLPPSQDFALMATTGMTVLPATDTQAMASLDVSHLLQEMQSITKMMNLRTQEEYSNGGCYFAGQVPLAKGNTRIQIKTERSQVLADYAAAHAKLLAQAEKVLAAAGARQRAQYQLHIDRLKAAHELVQLQNQIELARRQLLRRDAIAEAKARAIIAVHEASVRKAALRGHPAPAPPPASAPEDSRGIKKARLQLDLDRLWREEAQDIGKVTGGKPEAEWTDTEKNEVVRIQNMYEDARHQKCEQLRDCL